MPRNTMKVLTSMQAAKPEARPRPLPKVKAKPTAREVFRLFKSAPDYDAIVKRIPKAATYKGWVEGTEIAYFSVKQKTGSANWLDLWDVDHFDGFTDMQENVADNRAWFSHTGYSTWGSGQTATGRINCAFTAPSAGDYSCVVNLGSYPGSSTAKVECLIDSSSFGELTVDDSTIWPHFSTLSKGLHHFRIRQKSGSFFFLSLTVYRL